MVPFATTYDIQGVQMRTSNARDSLSLSLSLYGSSTYQSTIFCNGQNRNTKLVSSKYLQQLKTAGWATVDQIEKNCNTTKKTKRTKRAQKGDGRQTALPRRKRRRTKRATTSFEIRSLPYPLPAQESVGFRPGHQQQCSFHFPFWVRLALALALAHSFLPFAPRARFDAR